MAAAVNRLAFTARRCTCQIPSRTRPQAPIRSVRAFTTSAIARDDDDAEPRTPSRIPSSFVASLHPDDRVRYDSLSPSERREFEATARALDDHMTSSAVEARLSAAVSQAAYTVSVESPESDMIMPRIKPGFMAMGELDEQGSGEDEEFEDDDISSLGHGELEQHREMREYARLAAWEMPLLSSMLAFGIVIGVLIADDVAVVKNSQNLSNRLR